MAGPNRFKPGDLAVLVGLRRNTTWNGRIVTVTSHVFRIADYGGRFLRGPTDVVRILEHEKVIATCFLIPLPGEGDGGGRGRRQAGRRRGRAMPRAQPLDTQ